MNIVNFTGDLQILSAIKCQDSLNPTLVLPWLKQDPTSLQFLLGELWAARPLELPHAAVMYKHKERYLVSMQPIISLGTGASAEVDLDLVGIHLYIFWHVVSRSMSIETSY